MPSERQIGKLLNTWIKLNDLAQSHNLCIFLFGIVPAQKLPATVIAIMSHMQDRFTIAEYLSKSDNSNVLRVGEQPLLFQNTLQN